MADIESFFKDKKNKKIVADTMPVAKKINLPKIKSGNIIFIVGVLIILFSLGMAGYYYRQYKKITATNASQDEAKNYAVKISKFMVLPTDEVPTMATVADKDKLSMQPFFANAQNGDKVLFYPKAQKAILYRPSENKIVEASSMAGATQNTAIAPEVQKAVPAPEEPKVVSKQPQPLVSEETSAPERRIVRVAVYNGGNVKNLAASIADKISILEKVEIINKDNAKNYYAKTLVVDLTGGNGAIVQEIIKTIGGEAGKLPAGEVQPEADILIIGGKN